LYTQFGDSVNSQFIYKVQTDIIEELLNKDEDMALSKPVKISYYSINGKNLTSINTSGSELINAFNNSKTVFKDEERCVSDSWGECVKDNLTKAGGAELLVCMAMGKWCAGGLAAMCTVDVQFEIARPIYCD
jgi:propanediol dehydratase large subunit